MTPRNDDAPGLGFVEDTATTAAIDATALRDALAVAHRACDRARAEILPRFRSVAVETKADGSPVTEADRAAERVIREEIAQAFPDDAILGEEFGAAEGGAVRDAAGAAEGGAKRDAAGAAGGGTRRRWIIDPIDGTIAFSRGIPLFTTLIALTVDDVPVVGLIDLPAVDERIAGAQGLGLLRGDARASVSDGPALEQALVCHGDLYCFEAAGLRPAYDALSRKVPKLRGYTDAFGHLLVLTGAADAMLDCDLNPWDAAATRVLIREAGGRCWLRERAGGAKLDLLFGAPSTIDAIRGVIG